MHVWRTSISHCRWNANNTICNEMKVVWSGGGCMRRPSIYRHLSCHLQPTYRPSSIVHRPRARSFRLRADAPAISSTNKMAGTILRIPTCDHMALISNVNFKILAGKSGNWRENPCLLHVASSLSNQQ
jgi:hypothetical protein